MLTNLMHERHEIQEINFCQKKNITPWFLEKIT